jgi:hypothetical protein
MDRKWSVLVNCALVIALMVATTAPIAVSDADEGVKLPSQVSTGQPISAPVVVAQGRCFNGRCY